MKPVPRVKDYSIVMLVSAIVLMVILILFTSELNSLRETVTDQHQQVIDLQNKVDSLSVELTTAEAENEVLRNSYDVYVVAEELYGIDADVIRAIEMNESGHYSSQLYLNKNNTWGAYDSSSKTWKSFDSPEQSTMELARCLRYYYYDQYRDSIELIGEKFCPVDTSTWVTTVNGILTQLKGA